MTTLIPYLLPIVQAPFTEAQLILMSMVVTALLLVLLVEKEIIRAYGTENINGWRGAINIFAWPLLAVFAFLITMRFVGFILD